MILLVVSLRSRLMRSARLAIATRKGETFDGRDGNGEDDEMRCAAREAGDEEKARGGDRYL